MRKRRRPRPKPNPFWRLAMHGAHDACIDAVYEETAREIERDPRLRERLRRISLEILDILRTALKG